MKSLVIGGIIFVIALVVGTYFIVGDAFDINDYTNILSMLGLASIVIITIFVVLKYVNEMKNNKTVGELEPEKWDGIGKYKNPIPIGWSLSFIGVLIWLFWYWSPFGYPTNGFSQIGQWNEETLSYNKKFASKWKNPSKDTLLAMGESIFLVQCAPCHGIDAEGIQGKAQNLTNRISKDSVKYVIKNGAHNFKAKYPAGMPPMMLTNEKDIEVVASYVAGGLKGKRPTAFAVCAGCHGMDGKGMPYVGPNIVQYSNSIVAAVLNNGKEGFIGQMPNFKGRLNPTQEKALATYIRSLGK